MNDDQSLPIRYDHGFISTEKAIEKGSKKHETASKSNESKRGIRERMQVT